MRILHLLEATDGGTRRHVLDLLPQLQARGVACSLIYSAVRNPHFARDAASLQNKNIETHQIPMGHRWERRKDLQAMAAIRSHLNANRYDVIHCHSSNAGLLGRLANLTGSTPVVYTPHYPAFAAGIPRLQRRGALYLEKLLASQTSHYIAVSRHEYSLLRRVLKMKPERISVVHNGIDVESWRRVDPRSAILDSQLVVGCFGRLTAQKNQITLLRALPQVSRQVPNVQLKFVGGGEEESTLRAVARSLHVHDCVDFITTAQDAKEEYVSCDIVAHPSRWEGCSYALLEAMAAGKAIIASSAGGNPEVIGEAGVLLPPRDAGAWAKEIIELGQDEEKRRLFGEAARKRVESEFRLETMVNNTLRIYKSVSV